MKRSSPATEEPEAFTSFSKEKIVSRQKTLLMLVDLSIREEKAANFDRIKYNNVIYSLGEFVEIHDITLKEPYVARLVQIVKI